MKTLKDREETLKSQVTKLEDQIKTENDDKEKLDLELKNLHDILPNY